MVAGIAHLGSAQRFRDSDNTWVQGAEAEPKEFLFTLLHE